MSTLITERRRALENDDGQVSLFGGEGFAPARTSASWERPARPATPVREDAESAAAPTDNASAADARAGAEFRADLSVNAVAATESLVDVDASPRDVPAHAEWVAGEELVALEHAAVRDDVRKPRAPLAGPTLDDVMSRVWEGLVTGLPAACPVCRGEVVPSVHGALHGRCSSCGTMID
jgi:hypothetical protein